MPQDREHVASRCLRCLVAQVGDHHLGREPEADCDSRNDHYHCVPERDRRAAPLEFHSEVLHDSVGSVGAREESKPTQSHDRGQEAEDDNARTHPRTVPRAGWPTAASRAWEI